MATNVSFSFLSSVQNETEEIDNNSDLINLSVLIFCSKRINSAPDSRINGGPNFLWEYPEKSQIIGYRKPFQIDYDLALE